jgi:hypothetical protein
MLVYLITFSHRRRFNPVFSSSTSLSTADPADYLDIGEALRSDLSAFALAPVILSIVFLFSMDTFGCA